MNMIISDKELRNKIRKIWESVLSKKNISDDDKFTDLGGDASNIIDVVFQLEQELGIELPVEIFMLLATIEEMAYAIQALDKKTLTTSKYLAPHQIVKLKLTLASMPELVKDDLLMVKVNEQGTKPPLFWCFNSPGQEILPLAEKLDPDQPLYAMVSSVTLGRAPEILQNLAAHYVDEILHLYPEGPYYLGGNCRGARVICEIMFQLQAKGKQVDRLCLLESFNPKLFNYTGKLVLLFGKYSELQRHKMLHWGEAGWEKQFTKVPEVFFINCAHGQFFTNKNLKHLAKYVNHFLGLDVSKKGFFWSLLEKINLF